MKHFTLIAFLCSSILFSQNLGQEFLAKAKSSLFEKNYSVFKEHMKGFQLALDSEKISPDSIEESLLLDYTVIISEAFYTPELNSYFNFELIKPFLEKAANTYNHLTSIKLLAINYYNNKDSQNYIKYALMGIKLDDYDSINLFGVYFFSVKDDEIPKFFTSYDKNSINEILRKVAMKLVFPDYNKDRLGGKNFYNHEIDFENSSTSYSFFRISGILGDAYSCWRAYLCFSDGTTFKKNEKIANYWKEKACSLDKSYCK